MQPHDELDPAAESVVRNYRLDARPLRWIQAVLPRGFAGKLPFTRCKDADLARAGFQELEVCVLEPCSEHASTGRCHALEVRFAHSPLLRGQRSTRSIGADRLLDPVQVMEGGAFDPDKAPREFP